MEKSDFSPNVTAMHAQPSMSNEQGQAQSAHPASAGSPQVNPFRGEYYYSNLALIVSTPVDISIIFGRHVTAVGPQGQTSVPAYEKQIVMTLEQAESLVGTLSKAVTEMKAKKAGQ